MQIEHFAFGSLTIDGTEYDHDVVIDQGLVRKRNKGPSKKFQGTFGHTPLSNDEDIPWNCERLVIGTGAYGRLPIMDDVKQEAERRLVDLVILPTAEAIAALHPQSNAILHVTC